MGILSKLTTSYRTQAERAVGKALGADELRALKREATDHYRASSFDDLTQSQWDDFLAYQSTMDLGQTMKKSMYPIAGALTTVGVGGAGAYAYSVHATNERYASYQAEKERINQMYANGEISKAERDEMLRQAEIDYSRSQGNDNAGITLTEMFAEMSSLQFGILAAFAAFLIWYFGPKISGSFGQFSLLKAL